MTQARRQSSALHSAAHVHVRRAYSDGRHGQLHLTTAYPSGGGFDERTPLLCLHPSAVSGLWFRALLPELGRDRSVYAPDLPGHGQSDPFLRSDLGLEEHIAGIVDFLDSMRLRSIDVLGYDMGAAVAAGLAAQRPQQVRRLVLIALPASESRVADKPAVGDTLARTSRIPTARSQALSHETLVLSPADAPSANVESRSPQQSVRNLPQTAAELFDGSVAELARILRAFLDR